MRVYAVTLLCVLLGVSTQAYYKHEDTQMRKLAEEAFVVEFIKRIRDRDRGIGGSKLWRMYKKEFGEEHAVGYTRFYDIVDKYGLKVRKRRRRAKTTDSNHDYPTYPYLVKIMIPVRPNQLWASDITYMVIYVDGSSGDYKFCYLSLVTDYYTKEIVGWCVDETLEAKFAVEALNMALTRLDKNLAYDIVLLYVRPEREQEVRSPLLPLSCSVMYFAYAAAVSTINVTKPHMYQPNIKVMFNRVNQH